MPSAPCGIWSNDTALTLVPPDSSTYPCPLVVNATCSIHEGSPGVKHYSAASLAASVRSGAGSSSPARVASELKIAE